MKSRHAYDMLMQNLNAQIAQGEKDRDSKAEDKVNALKAEADAEGDLEDTTTTRDKDQKYSDELVPM